MHAMISLKSVPLTSNSKSIETPPGKFAEEERWEKKGSNASKELTDESDNACCKIITYNNLINGSINA
jgi:hypothetical protein